MAPLLEHVEFRLERLANLLGTLARGRHLDAVSVPDALTPPAVPLERDGAWASGFQSVRAFRVGRVDCRGEGTCGHGESLGESDGDKGDLHVGGDGLW